MGISNKETRQVLRDARAGKNMKTYASVSHMRRAIEGKKVGESKKSFQWSDETTDES